MNASLCLPSPTLLHSSALALSPSSPLYPVRIFSFFSRTLPFLHIIIFMWYYSPGFVFLNDTKRKTKKKSFNKWHIFESQTVCPLVLWNGFMDFCLASFLVMRWCESDHYFENQLSLNRCMTQRGADLETVHFEVCVSVWGSGWRGVVGRRGCRVLDYSA